MRFASTPDGASVAYDLAGSGPALLLLAGQGNNHHWWDPVRDGFAAHFTTIAVDWRGTGESGPSRADLSTRLLAEDLIAVLDHAGIARAHLYGTSMGGRVAQWFAIDHPERIGRLVLGCSSPGTPLASERSEQLRQRLADPDQHRARQLLRELMYTPEWLEAHPEPLPVEGDARMSPAAKRSHRRASDGHDAATWLPTITAPTLILHGTDDELAPVANAHILAEQIPGAELRLFPGLRHAYFHEAASTATPLASEFLRAAANVTSS